ncbi:MAG: MFS transporter [Oscillospiraceae bacterium]|jgi:fucose permease|nr:MFS transporter [Oscillospiraceae bacterium]
MKIKHNFTHTLYASYIGYITQAVINNFTPLLFLTFQASYALSLSKLTFLVTVNFLIQLAVDLLCAKFVDKIGYRPAIVAAHLFAAGGLAGLAVLPELFADPYTGLLLAVGLYAMGGGLLEVLVSPIVEACPTEKKSAAMSLLHSFYCWGHVFVVLASTLFFTTVGIQNWKTLALLWALIPLCNAFYFSRVPIARLHEEGESMGIRQLFQTKLFWLLGVVMVCAGASELAMSQWVSAFAEAGLHVSKTAGDLAGPCMFAALMGLTRVFYAKFSERIHLHAVLTASGGLCIVGYLLASLSPQPLLSLVGCSLCGVAVGMMWPGTFSIASASCPRGGTAMFALLALAGDLGCSLGPTTVGLVSGAAGGRLQSGLLAAIVFPAALIVGIAALPTHKK